MNEWVSINTTDLILKLNYEYVQKLHLILMQKYLKKNVFLLGSYSKHSMYCYESYTPLEFFYHFQILYAFRCFPILFQTMLWNCFGDKDDPMLYLNCKHDS